MAYTTGETSVRDHYTANLNTFAPTVPEPASLGVVGLGGVGLLARRHRV